jgi:hypothetical protein
MKAINDMVTTSPGNPPAPARAAQPRRRSHVYQSGLFEGNLLCHRGSNENLPFFYQ